MKMSPERSAITHLLGWTALLATLAVSPWLTLDPINLPKLVVIAAGGFAVIAALVSSWKALVARAHRTVVILCAAFALDLLLVLVFAGTNFYQELFGTAGRCTGFVAYISLTGLLLGSALIADKRSLVRVTTYLMAAGAASIAYGLIQIAGADPVGWVNKYNTVIGFLGNPNFQSSFVGFVGVMAFALIMDQQAKPPIRAMYALYFLLAIIVIIKTDSQQGLLVLAGGMAIVVLIWLSTSKLRVLTRPALLLSGVGAVFVALGSISSGPLASLLYKASVTYRGDYWRAGWKMTVEHPIFGVGLDSYGDWYRRARTAEATLRRGPEITSNAAHNVLLDFSSNGGFPLVIIYLVLVALVAVSAIKLIKRSVVFNPVISGLIAVWVAYIAQSIISLNQLGLAVWGWIISGLIIGYEINTREVAEPEVVAPIAKKGRQAKVKQSESVSAKSVIAIVVGFSLGLALSMPSFLASANFKSALVSGDIEKIQAVTSIWPEEPARYGQVALIFKDNDYEAKALEVAEAGLLKFPEEFGLWKILSELPNASAARIAEAKLQMKRLDPFNPDVK
jgi:O-antigen ligase